MDIVSSIDSFFEMLENYIDMFIEYLNNSSIAAILRYIFLCFPEPVRAIFLFTLVLMLIFAAFKALKR